LDIYGGEPFLLKKLPSVLDSAIEQDVSTNIRIHFNTNGSIFPVRLIPLLSKFKEVDIALSIDNVNGRFEIERGGVWKDVRENLIKWSSLSLPFKPYIFATVSIQNVFYLDELYSEAAQLKLPVVLNFLHKPTYLNIDAMTKDAKQLVFEKYQFDANPDLVKIAQRVINSPGSDGLKFIEYMAMIDSRRRQNFNLSHNAIANAMGYL
jgi:sulfatase maturation enzyme AslB (radical SAM superfamily)